MLLLTSNVFSQTPICHCDISSNVIGLEVRQLGQMFQLSHFYFTNDVMCRRNYDVIYHPFPINSQFWKLKWPQEKLKNNAYAKEHYGMLGYSLEWSIGIQASTLQSLAP